MEGGYVLPAIGTEPKSVPAPLEPGYYWIKTAQYCWEEVLVNKPGFYNDYRKNWDKATFQWEIVRVDHPRSFEPCGSDESPDWESAHIVAVSPRIPEPEEK